MNHEDIFSLYDKLTRIFEVVAKVDSKDKIKQILK